MKIILHADDAGASPAITDRILRSWKDGLLDGFSVLANDACLPAIGDELRANTEKPIRLSCHLNLIEGKSVCDSIRIPRLVDQKGIFRNGFIGMMLKWGAISNASKEQFLREVELEWRAQIEKVKTACAPLPITALDSHMHTHMLPFLFPVAAKLASAHGIPEIRITDEPLHCAIGSKQTFTISFLVNILKHLLLRRYARMARQSAKEFSLTFPDRFIGVLYTGIMGRASALRGIRNAERKGARRIEALFHIGRAAGHEAATWKDVPGFGRFYLSKRRNNEYRELKSVREVLNAPS